MVNKQAGSVRRSRGTVRVQEKIQETKTRQRSVHRQVGRAQAAVQWAWPDSWLNRNSGGNGLADRAKVSKIMGQKSQSKTGLGQKVE